MVERSVITGINVFIDGMGNIGKADSFKTAAINFKKLEQDTGVGKASITTPLLESLEVEFKFKAIPAKLFEEIVKLDGAKITAKRASVAGENNNAEEWVCVGGMNVEYGESKVGEYVDVTISQKGLRKYTYLVGNTTKVDIDHDNVKAEIAGKDLAASTKSAIAQ